MLKGMAKKIKGVVKMKRKILAALLAVAMLFALAGCSNTEKPDENGEEKNITLTVVHRDETSEVFPIKTTASNLEDALVEENLIDGEKSATGMFVIRVNGEEANSEEQEWWCLTKDGEMWMYGVKETEIEDGDKFEFTLTRGYE